MTKTMIAIAALSITATGALYSCKKDNTATPETTTQQPSVKRSGIDYMQQMGTTYNNWDEAKDDCGDLSGTCVKGVVVESPKPKIFSEVLTQGNAVSTGKFFTDANNHQYIPTAVLNDAKLMQFLSSGEAHSKLLTSSPSKEVYLIGQSANLTINNSLVMPVAIQD